MFGRIRKCSWTVVLCLTVIHRALAGVSREASCAGVDCGWGEECYLVPDSCSASSCYNTATCRPSCAYVICPDDYTCVDGQCVFIPSCNDYCDPDQLCVYMNMRCEGQDCSQYPSCLHAVLNTPCVGECPEGQYCQYGSCSPLPSCTPLTCNFPGDECYLQPLSCDSETPCPPVPACRRQLPSCTCGPGSACYRGHCVPLPNPYIFPSSPH